MKDRSQVHDASSKPEGAAVRVSTAESELLINIAGLLLSYGITPGSLRALMEPAFARSAARGAQLKNGRPSYYRIAARTGLRRSAVKDFLRDTGELKCVQASPLTQIVNGWRSNREFLDKTGKPRILAVNDKKRGFVRLTSLYVPDIPHRALCRELMDAGYVSMRRDSVRLRPLRQPKGPLVLKRNRALVRSLLVQLRRHS